MTSTRIISLAILTVFYLSLGASSQQRISTNEEILMRAVDKALQESDCCGDVASVSVDIPESGVERPIAYGLVEGFIGKGVEVSSGGQSSDAKVSFQTLGFAFEYKRGTSRGFLRKPTIKRMLDATIRILISRDEDGAVLSQEDLTITYQDEVDPGYNRFIRSTDIDSLAPDVPSSGWTKIVEPIVVTAAVGGLVYLFFANR